MITLKEEKQKKQIDMEDTKEFHLIESEREIAKAEWIEKEWIANTIEYFDRIQDNVTCCNCYLLSSNSSIPEWIVAVGTIFAVIGLVYTLLLQRKTLKEQQIITQLEQKRFLDSYLPILELSNINYSKNGQSRDIMFDIKIKENYLTNLEITHNFPEDYKVEIPYFIRDVILPKEHTFHFNIHFILPSVWIEIEEYSGNTIIFNFEDAFGNKYEQYLVYKGSKNLFMQPAFRKQI